MVGVRTPNILMQGDYYWHRGVRAIRALQKVGESFLAKCVGDMILLQNTRRCPRP